jgi:hypothetical protein
MTEPTRSRHRRRDDNRNTGLMFWYWLPVAGAWTGLVIVLLDRLLGS